MRRKVSYWHGELPFISPRSACLRAESKFVKLNCVQQVDFCPFRGSDAPVAHRRSYHACPVHSSRKPVFPGAYLLAKRRRTTAKDKTQDPIRRLITNLDGLWVPHPSVVGGCGFRRRPFEHRYIFTPRNLSQPARIWQFNPIPPSRPRPTHTSTPPSDPLATPATPANNTPAAKLPPSPPSPPETPPDPPH
jgi:hypothetical protein